MDFSRKPFASVAALLLLGLFTACSPAAEEPAALAQPSRGAHRNSLSELFRTFGYGGPEWELDTNPPFNPERYGFSACWIQRSGSEERRIFVFNVADSTAYRNFNTGGYTLQAGWCSPRPCNPCPSSGSTCSEGGPGTYWAKFHPVLQ
jgi:hypothetical protein